MTKADDSCVAEHRDLRALAHGDQGVGRRLAIGQHQHRRLQGHDAGNAALAVVGRCVAQVRDLALAQNLHAIRVDVVEVAHQIGSPSAQNARPLHRSGARSAPRPATHSHFREARNLQTVTSGADYVRFHGVRALGGTRTRRSDRRCQAAWVDCQPAIMPCNSAASAEALRRSRKLAVAEQLGNFGEDFQVLLRGRLGHQQKDQQADRLSSGASKPMGCAS